MAERLFAEPLRAITAWLPQFWPAHRTGRDHERETRQIEKRVLVAVRTHTSLNRVVEILHALGGDVCFAIKFVIDRGSKFARGLRERLAAMGMDEIVWEEAKKQQWDLVFAAHIDKGLSELPGPLCVIAHGVGYNRLRLASTGGTDYAAGLSPYELGKRTKLLRLKAFPAKICLSHEEQRGRMWPEARDRAVVIGDPVMDKLDANADQADAMRGALGAGDRKVILFNSTWGENSAMRAQMKLITRLVAELPSDKYLIAMIAHPNIWYGESEFEICQEFNAALDSGLVLVDYSSWQAALIAAHLLLGDHGSVSNYAIGLGIPVLIASDGSDELVPKSPVARLHADLPKLVTTGSLREHIERAIAEHDPGRWTQHTDQMFSLRGEALKTTVNVLRELMNLQPLGEVRHKQLKEPILRQGDPVTSHRVKISLDPGKPEGSIERYPAIATDFRELSESVLGLVPDHLADSILVVSQREIHQSFKKKAEIFIHSGPQPADKAIEWIGKTAATWPAAALYAAALDDGSCLVRIRDRASTMKARGDPFVVANTLYQLLITGMPLTNVRLAMRMGHTMFLVSTEQ